ncbi:hypothetical protein G9C85_13540 [Halorubellus sp. JP-L1]|uniref:hypothetical protein n=1 Tax=Halorubellus sp. JP-L1 TaxID=2715753 RepID=UPI00140916CC|nr:hypothetical protein [Halorubellus sp. JP-L1]NHN42645.1 hypothetical protein [Halorubellus sp. JP-L1]
MNAVADFDGARRDDLFRVAVATSLGVVGLYVAVVATGALLHGSVSRPSGDVVLVLFGLYAFLLGAWCGVRGLSDAGTVVVSGSYIVGILVVLPVAEYVEPNGSLDDPNLPLLAVLLVMVLGVVQAISYVGYLVGGVLAD